MAQYQLSKNLHDFLLVELIELLEARVAQPVARLPTTRMVEGSHLTPDARAYLRLTQPQWVLAFG